jgi:hypothetical protein
VRQDRLDLRLPERQRPCGHAGSFSWSTSCSPFRARCA